MTAAPQERPGARPLRRWLPFALRGALTLGVLAGLLWWLPTDELLAGMGRTGLPLWLGLVAGAAAGHAVAALKWRVLLRASGIDAPIPRVLGAHAAGLFANIWLPSLVGGDVVRAGLLARRDAQLAPLAAAGIADRLIDTFALILLAAAGLALTPEARSGAAWHLLEAAVGAVVLGGLAAPLALRFVDPRRLPPRLGRAVLRMRMAVAALLDQGGAALRALGLSLLVQGGFVWMNLPLARAIGIDLPPTGWLIVWPLAKVAALAPISLGGIGVREVAQVALLAPFGVAPTLAVAQSLVWESLMLALGLVAGLGWLALLRRREGGSPAGAAAGAGSEGAQPPRW